MSALPRKLSPDWVKFSERRSELVVCSKPGWWVSHFDHAAGRSRRCGGETCALCHMGMPRVLRFVMLCLSDRGVECLLELRERHRDVVERIVATTDAGGGVQIVGRKEGKASNSAVTVTVVGRVDTMLRDISRLIESLGLPAQHLRIQGEPEALNLTDQPLQWSPE